MTTSTLTQSPVKFTQARLEALPLAEGTRYAVKDSEQPGLICMVYPRGSKHPDGLKVLQVYRKPKGSRRAVRVKVCNLGELPMTALKGQPSVRAEADAILAKLRQGINPNDERREQQAEQQRQQTADALADITLADAFEKYVETKALRPQTLAGYRRAIERDLADWKDKPLRQLTGAMAVTRHAELTRKSRNTAARAMQTLRAVHHFATEFYGTDDEELPFGRCPVDKVNRVQRQWSRGQARTTKLTVDELRPWLAAVRALPGLQRRADGDWQRVALYLELILLTGLRRREAGYLRWADVDLRRGTLTVRATKNHRDHTLPITKRVRAILEQRKQALAAARAQAQREPTKANTDAAEHAATFVFGTAQVQRQLDAIEAETGIKAGPHDLRRTWANLADKVGLGAYAIKAALNHLTTGDVTGLHYAQVDVEDLRPLMQRVEDFILRAAEQRTDNVVELRAGSAQ